MKRFIIGLVMLVALVATAGEAMAARLNNIPLGWRFEASGTPGYVVSVNNIGSGATDTTTSVSTTNWSVPIFQQGLTASDSVVVARLIIAVDSTTATAIGATTLTVVVDGGIGGDVNWTQLASYTVSSLTATDKMAAIPLFVSNSKRINNLGAGNWISLPPALRFRITANGGAVASCRAFVQAFVE